VTARPGRLLAVAVIGALAAAALVVTFAGPDEGAGGPDDVATGPYVITAIDYHFHDAHPTFPIGPGRDLVVKNAGRNVHNVTIPALDYSRNVRPGRQLVIPDVASRLDPGRYTLVCRFHADRGMTGTVVIGR
jgi:plastocyanin